MRNLELADGTRVATLGQGTWHMGERGGNRKAEVAALRAGLDLGMTLVDTAEMYAEGGAEEVVGEAIAGRRDEVFLVSKVYPHNASRSGLPQACERSLKRLGVECLDLYLLHWRGSVPLADTVEAMERMRAAGKIARWGVSNLDVEDLEELGEALPACAANQVLLNLEHRGVEFDLLPFCHTRRMPVMAYSPLGQGGALLGHKTLAALAAARECSPAQIALAWTLSLPGVISIPKASSLVHLRENAAAAQIELTAEEHAALDAAFAPPRRKRSLAMI